MYFILIFGLINISIIVMVIKFYTQKSQVDSTKLTFEEYSKEVDLTQKCKKVRNSDINLLKFLYSSLPNGANFLYGGTVTVTEKMDGTQLWFRLDDKSIGDLRTHNGFQIGQNAVFTKDDVFCDKQVLYQRVNIGDYLHQNFDKFMKLFENFKTLDSDMKYCYVFMEVMLPISPCKISYPEELDGKNYIFEIISSTGKTFRINNKTSYLINSTGLNHVPIIGHYDFTEEGIKLMCHKIKTIDREGAIIEVETNAKSNDASNSNVHYFKLKNGAYDTSSFADRFVPKMYHDTMMHDIIDELISLANHNITEETLEKRAKGMASNNTRGNNGINELVMLLMEKEIGHNDWVGKFKGINGKQYPKFIAEFTTHISEKLKVENPDVLKTNHYQKIIKKCLIPKLKKLSKYN